MGIYRFIEGKNLYLGVNLQLVPVYPKKFKKINAIYVELKAFFAPKINENKL